LFLHSRTRTPLSLFYHCSVVKVPRRSFFSSAACIRGITSALNGPEVMAQPHQVNRLFCFSTQDPEKIGQVLDSHRSVRPQGSGPFHFGSTRPGHGLFLSTHRLRRTFKSGILFLKLQDLRRGAPVAQRFVQGLLFGRGFILNTGFQVDKRRRDSPSGSAPLGINHAPRNDVQQRCSSWATNGETRLWRQRRGEVFRPRRIMP